MAQVTSATMTYADCGFGKPISLTISCTGASCGSLARLPQISCTTAGSNTLCTVINSVNCNSSTFTASASFYQNNTTLTTAHNILINGTRAQFNTTGPSSINSNVLASRDTYAKRSSSSSTRSLSVPATILVIFFLVMNLCITPVYAQIPQDGSPVAILNQLVTYLPDALKGDVTGVIKEMCSDSVGTAAQNILIGKTTAAEAMETLIVNCIETITELEAATPLSAVVVANPETLWLVGLGDAYLCYKIADDLLFGWLNQGAKAFCDGIVSAITGGDTPGSSPPPMPPSPPSPPPPPSSQCSCLAPVCICPEDNGLAPLCGSTRDQSCGSCKC